MHEIAYKRKASPDERALAGKGVRWYGVHEVLGDWLWDLPRLPRRLGNRPQRLAGRKRCRRAARSRGFKVRVAYSLQTVEPAAIREMIEKGPCMSGRSTILVKNAGIQHVAPLQDLPTGKVGCILAINLSYAFIRSPSHAFEMATSGAAS